MLISNSRRPVRQPDETAVRGARTAYRTFCSPENRFKPEDVWGVLFWSRLEFAVDFVPVGRPRTGALREQCIVDAVKFWLTHARSEMQHAGFAPILEYPSHRVVYYALDRLDVWLSQQFLPSFDLTREEIHQDIQGRLSSIRRLWACALNAAIDAGLVSRETMLAVARRALLSAGIDPASEEELVTIWLGLRKEMNPGSIEMHFSPRTGQWTPGWMQMRDGSKTLRDLRYQQRRLKNENERHLSLDAPANADGSATHAPLLEDPSSLGGIEAVLRGRKARAGRRVIDAVRTALVRRQSVPVDRRDAKARASVRQNLLALWDGDLRQKELAESKGISRTRVSRTYRQELAAVRADVEVRLSSLEDPPPEAQSEENSSPM